MVIIFEEGKLHQYVQMMEERESNSKATVLNNIAAILLPVSIVTGVCGMNDVHLGSVCPVLVMVLGIACVIGFVAHKKKK